MILGTVKETEIEEAVYAVSPSRLTKEVLAKLTIQTKKHSRVYSGG